MTDPVDPKIFEESLNNTAKTMKAFTAVMSEQDRIMKSNIITQQEYKEAKLKTMTAEEAMESVLEDEDRSMKQFITTMGIHSRATGLDVTAQKELNAKLIETSENAILEGDYISKLSKADLLRHKTDLTATIATIKADKDGTKQLLNSIKNRTEYELKMRSIETEKKKAEDQGFMAMHVAKFHEMQAKVGGFATQYLGSGTKAQSAIGKNLGWVTLLAIAVMGLMYSLKKAGTVIKETNQGVMLSGGLKGRNWYGLGGNSNALQSTMQKSAGDTFTTVEMLELYNQATENGAISLAKLTLAQEQKINMDKTNQQEVQSLTMSSAADMKKMGMAIFGSVDILPEIYKTASMYNLNIRTETQSMLSFVANTSVEFGMHTNVMMEIISSLGEKIYMTGQGIIPTEYALSKLGETFKKVTKGNSNYVESLMQMAGKQAQSFDVLKYMAVAPGRTGDAGKDLEAALKVNPIEQMQTYLKTMVNKTGSASRLAFALPEFRSAIGIDFLKSMASTKLTGHETLAEMQKSIIGKSGTKDEEYKKMGAAIIKGGDVPHAILLYVQSITDNVAVLVSSVATAMPWLKNPALTKAMQVIKNGQIENNNLGGAKHSMASLMR